MAVRPAFRRPADADAVAAALRTQLAGLPPVPVLRRPVRRARDPSGRLRVAGRHRPLPVHREADAARQPGRGASARPARRVRHDRGDPVHSSTGTTGTPSWVGVTRRDEGVDRDGRARVPPWVPPARTLWCTARAHPVRRRPADPGRAGADRDTVVPIGTGPEKAVQAMNTLGVTAPARPPRTPATSPSTCGRRSAGTRASSAYARCSSAANRVAVSRRSASTSSRSGAPGSPRAWATPTWLRCCSARLRVPAGCGSPAAGTCWSNWSTRTRASRSRPSPGSPGAGLHLG